MKKVFQKAAAFPRPTPPEYVLALLCFLPFLYLPFADELSNFLRALVLQILVALLLAALVFYYKEIPFHANALTLALAVFLGSQAVAAMWGVDPLQSFLGRYDRMTGVVSLLAAVMLAASLSWWGKKDARIFQKAFLLSSAAATILSLIGLGQYFGLTGWFLPSSPSHRISSITGNPSFFAAYLLFNFAFALFLLGSRGTKGFARMFLLVMLGVQFFALLATGTRGAYAGFTLGVGAALWFLLRDRIVAVKPRFLAGAAVAVVFAMVLGTGLLFLSSAAFPDGNSRSLLPSVMWFDDASVTGRLLAWKVAWQGFLARPFTGFGPENFEYSVDTFYDPALLRFYDEETIFADAHNGFFALINTSGIIGLAAVLLVGAVIVLSLRELKKTNKRGAAALLFGLAAYAGANFFFFDTPVFSLMPLALFLGFLGTVAPQAPRALRLSVPQFRGARKVAGGLCLVAAFSIFTFAAVVPATLMLAHFIGARTHYNNHKATFYQKMVLTERVASSFALWKPWAEGLWMRFAAANLKAAEAPDSFDAEFVKGAFAVSDRRLEEIITGKRGTVRVQVVRGLVLEARGFRERNPEYFLKAERIFENAFAQNPNRQLVAFALAKNLFHRNRVGEALALLRFAVSTETSAVLAHEEYAHALAAAGYQAAAASLLQEAAKIP